MKKEILSSHALAARITYDASKQTYYTIRLLVDRDRVADAFRAYAYFRWVDDRLDKENLPRSKRVAFVLSQKELVERCYLGDFAGGACLEERLLVDLIRGDREVTSGLKAYIRNMMAVMAFDADRRGRLIEGRELAEYTRWLATAVTEALHYFIGHDCLTPFCEERYLSASAAHITHMLRDTLEDNEAGFYNIPREVLVEHRITPQDVASEPYRMWVRSRVRLARAYFEAGRRYLSQARNHRCRLAGHAYIARFEGLLDVIAKDDYHLRTGYEEYKGLGTGIRAGISFLALPLKDRREDGLPNTLPSPEETY